MKSSPGWIAKQHQLQWVALLAIAVVLPTVCLLWFMSQVVANERLVIQQKLSVLYLDKLADIDNKASARLSDKLDALDRIDATGNAYGLLRRIVLEEGVEGVVIWGLDGQLIYPRAEDGGVADDIPANSPLADAWELEFVKHDPAAAAQQYARLATELKPHQAQSALAGLMRCSAKTGRMDEMIAACRQAEQIALQHEDSTDLLTESARTRLLLLSLLRKAEVAGTYDEAVRQTIHSLENDLFKAEGRALPADQNRFIAQKLLDWMGEPEAMEPLRKLVAAEAYSMSIAEGFKAPAGRADAITRMDIDGTNVFILRHRTANTDIMTVLSKQGMGSVLDEYRAGFPGTEPAFRIMDNQGGILAGQDGGPEKPFVSVRLPESFPDGRVELYFDGDDTFQRASDRQVAVYIWTGGMVILLFLTAGCAVAVMVNRQVKLNRLKNDFIATVSHELKTPLASMRVLMDTLFEGHYEISAQVLEYLQMISHDNLRLTRLIDNFLTFSRMERNKQVFVVCGTEVQPIVQEAIDTMHTKLGREDCRFDLSLPADLPPVLADRDALVMVLINLLDNAFKYSNAPRQISLTISEEEQAILFTVTDHGIGMTPRAARRIFDKFYQVDQRLTRQTEGCGLGLSIVQFIVEAHQGSIQVESILNEGSTFMVRMPRT